MALPSRPILKANTVFTPRSRICIGNTALSGVTAVASTDVITSAAHGLSDGDQIEYTSGTGFTGLTVGTIYYVRDKDTNTFKVAATSGGAAIDITVDGSAGVFTPVEVFEAVKLSDSSPAPTMKPLFIPDDQGVNRKLRTDMTEQSESWVFDLLEITRLMDLFGGAMSGIIDRTAWLYIPDTKDASGKVKLKSEKFDATITRGGGIDYSTADHSKTTITIESNKTTGAVQWTADASV